MPEAELVAVAEAAAAEAKSASTIAWLRRLRRNLEHYSSPTSGAQLLQAPPAKEVRSMVEA